MLLHFSDPAGECHLHAKRCAREAAAQSDSYVRQSFLDAQQHWLKLAKQLADFPALERPRE